MSESVPEFGWIIASGFLGGPITFASVPLRNQTVDESGYGWRLDALRSKKWQSVYITPLRLMRPVAGCDPRNYRKLDGGVWFRESDRAEAESRLRAQFVALLNDMRGSIVASLDSLA